MGLVSAPSAFPRKQANIEATTGMQPINFTWGLCISASSETQASLARCVRLRHSWLVNIRQHQASPYPALRTSVMALALVVLSLPWSRAASPDGEDWPRFLGP